MGILDLAAQNLLSPMVLFFALGAGAALARSDLAIPEAIAKGLALYLMLAIGFKGGVAMADGGVDGTVLATLLAAAVLSFTIPAIGYGALRRLTRLDAVDAAAVAAHYGSISIVTFVAATEAVRAAGLAYEGHLIAAAAVMETPAIVTALFLAHRSGAATGGAAGGMLWREIALNGSIVLLTGTFAIGWTPGADGMAAIAPFIVAPFKGVLCLFLLDMGLLAGRGLRDAGHVLDARLVGFGLVMPLVSAALATLVAWPLPIGEGGKALLIVLAASASYIAVPAAVRLALPQARPAVYLTLSLGVTFPFNLTIGIPLCLALAGLVG